MAAELSSRPLTDRQKQILDAVRRLSKRGYPPSVREIAAATGIRSPSTVHQHLMALKRKGALARDHGMRRLRIVPEPEPEAEREAAAALARDVREWFLEDPWAAESFQRWRVRTGRVRE